MTTKNGALLEAMPETVPPGTSSEANGATIIPFPQVTPALNDEADSWLNNPNRRPLAEMPLEEALFIVSKMAADSWLEGIDRTPYKELPPEVLHFIQHRPIRIEYGDDELMDRLGYDNWLRLAASRPVPEWAKEQVLTKGELLGPFMTATSPPPAGQLCQDYLTARGITDETVRIHGLEFDDRLSADTIKARLGRVLPKGVLEVIWIPYYDDAGNVLLRVARPLPTIGNGQPKFICPVGSDCQPYIPKPVYHLALGLPVIVPEGPVKALACLQSGYAAIGLNGIWGAGVKDSNDEYRFRADLYAAMEWRGRHVYLAFDADLLINPDVRQALFRTLFLFKTVGAEIFHLGWDLAQGKGIDDYLVQANGQDPAAALNELVANARPLIETVSETSLDLGLIASELKKVHLPPLLRDQLCGELAKRLKVSPSSLRATGSQPKAAHQPSYAADIEPWPDPVDGENLLHEISALLRRVVVMDEHSLVAVTMWILLSYLADTDAIDTLALLVVLSPVKRCGKTRLLTSISRLMRRWLYCVRPSAAVTYRVMKKHAPAIIVDEADDLFINNKGQENAELREVFCAGFNRGVSVPRCVGDNHDVEEFPTWCPKAIGLNGGKLPDPIYDRSIPIKLQRKTKKEKTEPLRAIPADQWLEFRRKILRFINDIVDRVGVAKPTIPKGMNDRADDAWIPLLAIAEIVGGDWPKFTQAAALKLSAVTDDQDKDSLVIAVVQGVKQIYVDASFTDPGDFLASDHIVTELNKDKYAPWANWKRPLSVKKLGGILQEFSVKPEQKQINNVRARGYFFGDLKPVFDRYL